MGDILQPTHLIFILLVALLVLGPKRLPEVGRSLGRGIRDFRGAMAGIEDEAREVFSPEAKPLSPAPADAVAHGMPDPVEHAVAQTVTVEPQTETVTGTVDAPPATDH